ncbi:MAG: hypothetical protein EB127_19150 [Alphaproteobacteria bacterium]|nr:hypothetical protein [Alphaproteobacteria bacterium]
MKFDKIYNEWVGNRPERSEWDALKQQERSHRDYLRGDRGFSDKRASRDPGLEHAMSMMPKKLTQNEDGFYTDETGKRWEMKKPKDGPAYLVPLKS